MSGFVNRIKSWVTGDDYEDDVYSIDEEFEPMDRPMYPAPAAMMSAMSGPTTHHEDMLMERPSKRQKNLRVVESPAAQSNQVIVIEPKAFEESLEIVEHLRAKKSVILNLHLLDTAQSQRVVDFLSGATHAIDGNQQRIGDGVFIFTPNHVSISTEQAKTANFTTEAFWTQR